MVYFNSAQIFFFVFLKKSYRPHFVPQDLAYYPRSAAFASHFVPKGINAKHKCNAAAKYRRISNSTRMKSGNAIAA